MDRFIWESKEMSIEYSDPSIQEFDSSKEVKTFDDVLHFYYTVTVRVRDVEVMKARVHDFPKVQHVARAVEDIIMKPVDTGCLVRRGKNGIPSYYINVVNMMDSFYYAAEYAMKFERADVVYVDGSVDSDFTLTIGKTPFISVEEGYSEVGTMYAAFGLTDRDLMGLSNVTKAFCEFAIQEHENEEYEDEEV